MKIKNVIFIVVSIMMIALVLTGCSKKKEEQKNYDKENYAENVENNNAKVDELIKAEIDKKEFLKENGINQSEVMIYECRLVESGIYLVSVSYQPEYQPTNSKAFVVTYKEGKVNFDVIQEHKYLSETVEYDSDKKVLRLSAEYHDRIRENYFKLENGKFKELENAKKSDYNLKEIKPIELDAFSENDLKVNGITFGSKAEDVTTAFGNNFNAKEYTEDASGDSFKNLNYGNGQMNFTININGENKGVDAMEFAEGSTVKTSRGIGVGSSKREILNAYPQSSILRNDAKTVVVGFPGDKDEYSSKGRIYFTLKENKVSSMKYIHRYAE